MCTENQGQHPAADTLTHISQLSPEELWLLYHFRQLSAEDRRTVMERVRSLRRGTDEGRAQA
jgi:hypothetical protein